MHGKALGGKGPLGINSLGTNVRFRLYYSTTVTLDLDSLNLTLRLTVHFRMDTIHITTSVKPKPIRQ